MGHSGGPVVNRHGQVIGWSDVSHAERVRIVGSDGSIVPGTEHLRANVSSGGLHALKPINDALGELAAEVHGP